MDTEFQPSVRNHNVIGAVAESRRRWAALAVLDNRSAEEILGYDENGLLTDGDRHISYRCDRPQ